MMTEFGNRFARHGVKKLYLEAKDAQDRIDERYIIEEKKAPSRELDKQIATERRRPTTTRDEGSRAPP
jgi:hypothetical protein